MSRRRSPLPFGPYALALAAVVLPAALFWTWYDAQPRAIAEYEAWHVVAPACHEISQAQFSSLPAPEAPPHFMAFDEVTFIRRGGAAACNRIVDKEGRGFNRHPVCQFSSPDILVVRAGKTIHRYVTGAHPATVTVEHGRASCVLDSHFKTGAWPEESQPS